MGRITTAYVGLGSNLGDRERYIRAGVDALIHALECPARLSPLYETDPLDLYDQPSFLNAVLELAGELPSPGALLELCLGIESRLGRERDVDKGPRTLDLDLLLFGEVVSCDERLMLPHPRMHERLFVLEPLADLAPDIVHPLVGSTIRDLRDAVASAGEQRVTRI